MRGLAIIAAVFAFISIVWLNIPDDKFSAHTYQAQIDTNDCGYQLIRNGKVLGTVFLNEPTTIDKISGALGAKGLTGGEVGRVFPCSTVLIFDRDGHLLDVQRLSGSQIVACGKRIELSSASEEDIQSVPGIGPGIAKRIEGYKRAFGPFQGPADLAKVKGIGSRKVQEFQIYLK